MFYLTTHSTHCIYGYMASDTSYMHHPTYRITHTTTFVTPVVEHWLERETAQRVHILLQNLYCYCHARMHYQT